MPDENTSNTARTNQYICTYTIFGPLRPHRLILRDTTRVRKGTSGGVDTFTDISVTNPRHTPGFVVQFWAYASSPKRAEHVGAVYVSHLCDLLSVVTRQPTRFYGPDEDSRHERVHAHNQTASTERVLTKLEWDWITGTRAHLQDKHARYLAAASSYRKGLLCKDNLDCLCCYWRAIERLAMSYADKSSWPAKKKERSTAFDCIEQLATDLFENDTRPCFLGNPDNAVKRVKKLRDDISHGNESITPAYIEAASEWLEDLEDAAYTILNAFRQTKLSVSEI